MEELLSQQLSRCRLTSSSYANKGSPVVDISSDHSLEMSQAEKSRLLDVLQKIEQNAGQQFLDSATTRAKATNGEASGKLYKRRYNHSISNS
jgi:hypothetical protein